MVRSSASCKGDRLDAATCCHAFPAGNGVVVHQSDTLGLVVVDRNTVAVGAGDVRLTFGAAPAEADAAIRFLHPLHNFALLSYDPAALPAEVCCPVQAAPILRVQPATACRRLGACASAEEWFASLHAWFQCVLDCQRV